MIIAISVDGDQISMHFGRCEKYVLFDIKNGKIIDRKEIKTPSHKPFFIPKFLAERGVEILITGGIGPRAINLFKELNVKVISGVEGRTDDVIKRYLEGEIDENLEPCEEHKDMM
jgi:predicted Fe-Mo cluster-binding NifX family protein